MSEDLKLLEDIVKAIVENPVWVKIERGGTSTSIVFAIHVSASDMPRLIGRGGDTIKGIRSIFNVIGYRVKSKYTLNIEEPK